MIAKQLLASPMFLLMAGCAVVAPMYDRSLAKAPNSACAEFVGPPQPVADAPLNIGCFTVKGGSAEAPSELTSEGLILRSDMSFRLGGDPKCAGNYTNIVIRYAAPQGGKATVLATNVLGMPLGSDRLKADASAKEQTFVLRGVGDALKHPINAEVSEVEGEILLRSVCLKGYWA